MCLTADDCGLVLDAIAGRDPDDPTTSEREFRYEAGLAGRRFRLGVMADAPPAEDDVQANLSA